jgi:hypothetical protein
MKSACCFNAVWNAFFMVDPESVGNSVQGQNVSENVLEQIVSGHNVVFQHQRHHRLGEYQ